MNARQKNKSDKVFKIKVDQENGFSLHEIQAATFGQACYRLEKEMLKRFQRPKAFKLIE